MDVESLFDLDLTTTRAQEELRLRLSVEKNAPDVLSSILRQPNKNRYLTKLAIDSAAQYGDAKTTALLRAWNFEADAEQAIHVFCSLILIDSDGARELMLRLIPSASPSVAISVIRASVVLRPDEAIQLLREIDEVTNHEGVAFYCALYSAYRGNAAGRSMLKANLTATPLWKTQRLRLDIPCSVALTNVGDSKGAEILRALLDDENLSDVDASFLLACLSRVPELNGVSETGLVSAAKIWVAQRQFSDDDRTGTGADG